MVRKSSRKSSRKASSRKASSRKASRKSSRKTGRKASRKMMYGGSRRSSCMMRGGKRTSRRKASRRSSRKMMMYGGNPSAQSLAQGVEYGNIHAAQRGGAAVSLAAAAPVGYTGMLDESLRAIARIAPLDQSIGQIQGLSDQSGGARKRRGGRRGLTARVSKAGKTVTRKLKMMRTRLMKMMRRMTKGRMMRGGAALTPAAYGTPGMLLPPAMEAKALAGMNPEWKLATDPAAFAPKML